MESLRTYRGNSSAEHHHVLEGVVWDRQELIEFYKQFDESCHLPWNEFKKKYNPDNPYRKTLTDKFRQIYAPNLEGKELIEYPIIQKFIKQFNFDVPLGITDVQILAYEPGFVFPPHTDQEVQLSIMVPILPEDGGEPLKFIEGDDWRNPGKDIYQVYYSTEYPTLVAGKVIHSVDEMKGHRVVLRFRTDGETYENVIEKIKRGEFILPLE